MFNGLTIKRIAYLLSCIFILICTFCCRSFREEINDTPILDKPDDVFVTRANNTVEYMGHQYAVTHGPLTIAEARTIYSDTSLMPTHKAVRILPESMKQLHRLEADTALTIYDHPFGYVLLPDPDELNADDYVEGPDAVVSPFKDECVVVDDQDDECEVSPVYVLWPVSHPVPDDLEFEALFDAYLENNSIVNRGGGPIQPASYVEGYLRSYDNRSGQYKPIRNVRLEYRGELDFVYSASTDSLGYFMLPYCDVNYPLVIKLQNDKFTVRDSLTSNVKSFSLSFSNYALHGLNGDTQYLVSLPSNFFLDVYKAAEYYFYGHNDLLDIIPCYDTLGVSIDIHAINAINPNANGSFSYSLGGTGLPNIKIWNGYKNNYTGACSNIFEVVNHELGHATHYAAVGALLLNTTSAPVKESLASFFGWYNVFQYYYSYVGGNHYYTHLICYGHWQFWTPSSPYPYINYTPIFVDLVDDYNQHIPYDDCNDDPISGVPVSFIIDCALGPTTLQSVYDNLLLGVGVYYTAADFSTFFSPYLSFL